MGSGRRDPFLMGVLVLFLIFIRQFLIFVLDFVSMKYAMSVFQENRLRGLAKNQRGNYCACANGHPNINIIFR